MLKFDSNGNTRRRLAGGLAFATLMAMAWPCFAEGDPALLGCWEIERIFRYNGSELIPPKEENVGCTLNYSVDHLLVLCVTPQSESRVEYAYRISHTDTYRATIIANSSTPSAVGSIRDFEYKVQKDRLVLALFHPAADATSATGTMRPESVAVRRAPSFDCRPERKSIAH
jgi:hypothetical protein